MDAFTEIATNNASVFLLVSSILMKFPGFINHNTSVLFIYFQPLVAQQIEACYKIMGVPQADMAEMTGNVAVSTREKQWQQKRVFFLTPQVMSNDLSRGLFPADQVCMRFQWRSRFKNDNLTASTSFDFFAKR